MVSDLAVEIRLARLRAGVKVIDAIAELHCSKSWLLEREMGRTRTKPEDSAKIMAALKRIVTTRASRMDDK
jgi:hypothetical protein